VGLEQAVMRAAPHRPRHLSTGRCWLVACSMKTATP
jgi:hypothetical protein